MVPSTAAVVQGWWCREKRAIAEGATKTSSMGPTSSVGLGDWQVHRPTWKIYWTTSA
jgi:cytochrome oxidase assembly protein ShyY1